MINLLENLQPAAVRKIHRFIEKSGEESIRYVVRVPYRPNSHTNTHIFILVEFCVNLQGAGWAATNLAIPCSCPNHEPGEVLELPWPTNQSCVIDLQWQDLSKKLQTDILSMGRTT